MAIFKKTKWLMELDFLTGQSTERLILNIQLRYKGADVPSVTGWFVQLLYKRASFLQFGGASR